MISVICCGGRTYANRARVFAVLDAIHAETPISSASHGVASGADALAEEWAEGHEAGRLAAIRAEVERAIPDLVDAVALAVDREQARRVEVHDSRSRWSFSRGLRVGVWHLQERKRRAAIGLLAATRRWLQETA